MAYSPNLQAHLDSGATTLCRAWGLRRTDGLVLGFTDHDEDLAFDSVTYRANSGLSAQALQQSTGLSVDNTEAVGALQGAAITEKDISAGRYDGAEIETWLVNWANPDDRSLMFRGSIGEIQYGESAFQAELRGLTEALNTPRNRVFQDLCQTGLGSPACGIDMSGAAYSVETTVQERVSATILRVTDLSGFEERWFERGQFEVLSGLGQGLRGLVKSDTRRVGYSEVSLWEELRCEISAGDVVRLQAGCDKAKATCRDKFQNTINFQGFPHIPGDDWLLAYPVRSGNNNGGKRT